MKKLVVALIFGFASSLSAETPEPDTSKNYPPFPKLTSDTTVPAAPKPSLNDSIVNETMKQSHLRSPSGALLRSLAVPGWGQLYNKKYFKAVVIAGGQGILLGTAIVEWKRASDSKKDLDFEGYRIHTNNRNLFLWLYAGATVFSMIDAYVDSHLSQDTGEGVPRIGNIFLESDVGKKAVWLKLKINL